MAKSAVGLEIDTGEIRAVELRGSAQSPRLVNWGRIALPDNVVLEGMIQQPDAVCDALEQLWSATGFGSREVILGIANQGVLVRFATFPKVAGNKLDKLIQYQSQEYIPLPLSSVVLDYMLVGETAGETGPLLEVLLVAARRDMINSFLSLLAEAHLKVLDIDVSVLSLLRVLPAVARKGAYALVDIGNGLSNILIVNDGVPRFARQISTALKSAAAEVGCALDDIVPPAGTESHNNWSQESFDKWSGSLAGEIRSSLTYWQAQQQTGALVESIILSGRGARLEGLGAKLQEDLGLGLMNIQPLEGVVLKRDDAQINRMAPDFAVGISLARRGLEG